jgi:hypothetical protein
MIVSAHSLPRQPCFCEATTLLIVPRYLVDVLQEEKAYLSKVGINSERDYSIVFKDAQDLQRPPCKRVPRASDMFTVMLKVSERYSRHMSDEHIYMKEHRDDYEITLIGYQRTVSRLSGMSSRVSETIRTGMIYQYSMRHLADIHLCCYESSSSRF